MLMSCAERAEHCERMAALVDEPEKRSRFIELARLWRGMIRLDERDSPTSETSRTAFES
jgi:hypothetical protein